MKSRIVLIVLIFSQLACAVSAVQPATPTEMREARPAERLPLVRNPVSVGFVVVETVYVRELGDLSAPVVGYLSLGAVVLPLECVSLDDLVWVRHAEGWTVARNRSAEYIAGVCYEE